MIRFFSNLVRKFFRKKSEVTKVDLPPALREQYAQLTTATERQAFLKKHWRDLSSK